MPENTDDSNVPEISLFVAAFIDSMSYAGLPVYVSLSLFSAQAKPIKLHLKCLVALVFVVIVCQCTFHFHQFFSAQAQPAPIRTSSAHEYIC